MTTDLLFLLIVPAIIVGGFLLVNGMYHLEDYNKAVKAMELLHAGYTASENKYGQYIYVAPDGDERGSIGDAYTRMMKVREIKEWNLPEPKEIEAHSWR